MTGHLLHIDISKKPLEFFLLEDAAIPAFDDGGEHWFAPHSLQQGLTLRSSHGVCGAYG